MSKARPRQSMPPGLKSQIAFAVILTLGALILLPTALSANHASLSVKQSPKSAGTVSTRTKIFQPGDFQAAAYSDWNVVSQN